MRANGAHALLLGKCGACLILSAALWNSKALAFMAEVDGWWAWAQGQATVTTSHSNLLKKRVFPYFISFFSYFSSFFYFLFSLYLTFSPPLSFYFCICFPPSCQKKNKESSFFFFSAFSCSLFSLCRLSALDLSQTTEYIFHQFHFCNSTGPQWGNKKGKSDFVSVWQLLPQLLTYFLIALMDFM